MLGSSHCWVKPMQNSEDCSVKQHIDLLYIRAIQGRSGTKIQDNSSRRNHWAKKAMRKSSTIGLAKNETAIKQGGADTWLLRRRQRTTSSLLHALSTTWTATLTRSTRLEKHAKPHHNVIYVVDMEGAQEEDLKLQHDLQGVHQNVHPHHGQGEI